MTNVSDCEVISAELLRELAVWCSWNTWMNADFESNLQHGCLQSLSFNAQTIYSPLVLTESSNGDAKQT